MRSEWIKRADGARSWAVKLIGRGRTRLLAVDGDAAAGPPASAVTEISAGIVASLVTLSHCLSLSALIFAGELQSGLGYGLWAFLAGTTVACILVALCATMPPMIAGPRNPPIAVISVLAATISGHVLAGGGSSADAVRHVLIGFAIATLLTGLVMWLLGRLQLGGAVRFVPFPVIGGFLAASGWFLITGALRVATGREIGPADLMAGLPPVDAMKIAVAVVFVGVVQALRRWRGGSSTLPFAFFLAAVLIDVVLWYIGARAGWYLPSGSTAQPWAPMAPALLIGIDWHILVKAGTEIGSVVGVATIALLLDVSTLEAQRAQTAAMDDEFRVNGLANVVIAPLGGVVMGMAPNASRLVDQLGGRTRLSGVSAGLFIGAILASGLDVTALVPTPVLGGLLLFLGLGVMKDALWPAPEQRSRLDLMLALVIMFAIVRFGYLTGVVLGLVGACMTFAFRYSRIGVIRRHATRAHFAAPVERALEAQALLAREGERIHVLWLAGYIFFGSSNGVFEQIRRLAGETHGQGSRWIVLDMSGVTGLDASAMLSFVKLRNWAGANGVHLAYAALPQRLRRRFALAGLGMVTAAGDDGSFGFSSRSEALEWCEQGLLRETNPEGGEEGSEAFGAWLGRELGDVPSRRLIERYLVRRELAAGETICAQGEAADTIDLVASGSIAVTVRDDAGRDVRVRRMTGRTVVGEMGFFRHIDRSATVSAERPTRVYTMSFKNYAEMVRSEPALATVFLEFIVRALSDRVEFATKEIAVLM